MNAIQQIFSEVGPTYDFLNWFLTWGMDNRWRRAALKNIIQKDSGTWLDVCCGTGEMTVALRKFAPNGVRLVALDFSLPMMREAVKKPGTAGVSFCLGSADSLPFPDGTFDLITVSFATRNLNTSTEILQSRFKEFLRVLKTGGRYVNIETSQPRFKIIRILFHLYIRMAVKPIGLIVSGSKKAYTYLSYTIPRFFSAEQLADILLKSGFKTVDFSRKTFGACAIHVAIK